VLAHSLQETSGTWVVFQFAAIFAKQPKPLNFVTFEEHLSNYRLGWPAFSHAFHELVHSERPKYTHKVAWYSLGAKKLFLDDFRARVFVEIR
jgi:hypothetical protein